MKNYLSGATSVLLCVCLSLTVSSCYRLGDLQGHSTDVITTGDLGSRVEFAVAPIVDVRAPGSAAIPENALRSGFQRALLKRRYSPLSLEYIDRQVVNAAYEPGSAQEEAVLIITIEEWDASLWDIHRALNVKIEAVALDPEDPAGAVLWKARSERRFDKGDFGNPAHQPTELRRMQHACNVIAAEIMTAMPARTEAPGQL